MNTFSAVNYSPKSFYAITFFLLFLSVVACQKNDNGVQSSGEWLVPSNEVRDGGPGKDGIPSVDNPEFIEVNAVSNLSDNDLVVGVKVGEEIKAYPHPILDWHEIVNDEIGGQSLALTYCPLTGTGIGWNRMVNGVETEFGVSGLLYNSNLIPYDRNSDSYWSQMRLDCVNGDLIQTDIEVIPVIETTWATWKRLYPNSKVMSTNTGFSRDYQVYPYGNYRTDDRLIFPVSNTDNRLSNKERVLGVIVGDAVKAYAFNNFANGVSFITDEIGDKSLIIVGNISQNYIVVFERTLADGSLLNPVVEPMSDLGGTGVLKDAEGNVWSIFGEAISGPRMGEQLTIPTSYIGYWFSWAAFYPNLELYR